jgi:hypothetical protein
MPSGEEGREREVEVGEDVFCDESARSFTADHVSQRDTSTRHFLGKDSSELTVVKDDGDGACHPDRDDYEASARALELLATTRARESACVRQEMANALMMAGMVIFLGWLAGGRASAILGLSVVLHRKRRTSSR